MKRVKVTFYASVEDDILSNEWHRGKLFSNIERALREICESSWEPKNLRDLNVLEFAFPESE